MAISARESNHQYRSLHPRYDLLMQQIYPHSLKTHCIAKVDSLSCLT